MDEQTLRTLLEQVRDGGTSIESALDHIRTLDFADLGFARVDHHRELRTGLCEAIYGPGKTATQVAAIADELCSRTEGAVVVTRADQDQYAAVIASQPAATYDDVSRVIVVQPAREAPAGVVVVASAGTADQAVAEEAAVVAESLSLKVERVRDVGVAGIHRLLASAETLARADVVIVVAGMDGALASVVGGLVPCPVVAVPTSVGYGAGAGGIAPLLTMLNSCAPGVAVVNIDNGYGAAVYAAAILRSRR